MSDYSRSREDGPLPLTSLTASDAIAAVEGGAAPASPALASHRRLLWLIAAALFMQTLDSTIINTATPSIAAGLHSAPLQMKTALTSYVLAMALCIPVTPWLCDRMGTRRVFALAIVVFCVGSILCGISQSLGQLVAARFLQGMGGALLMPVGSSVLVRFFGPREYLAAMTFISVPGMVGPAMGPLMGGLLSSYLSWRWVFLINVPIGITGLLLVRHTMPDFRRAERRAFDGIGFALFSSASILLMAASESLTGGSIPPWGPVACLMGSLACGALYVTHSRRRRFPVIDLSLLRIQSLRISLCGALVTRLSAAGFPLLLTLYLQLGRGFSAAFAGTLLVSQALGSVAMKPFVTRLIRLYGYRRVLQINTLAFGLVLFCSSVLDARTPLLGIVAVGLVSGLVVSLQYSAMNTLCLIDVRSEDAAMGASMNSTAQFLSVSLGIALASLLMEIFLVGSDASSYVRAFKYSCTCLALLTAVASGIFSMLSSER